MTDEEMQSAILNNRSLMKQGLAEIGLELDRNKANLAAVRRTTPGRDGLALAEATLGAARGCYDIARNAIAVVDQQDKTIINLMAQVSLLKERKPPLRVVQDNESPPEAG